MEDQKEKKPRNGLILLTTALMFLALAFGFKKKSDYNKLEQVFVKEKKALKNDLDELIEDYRDLSIKKKTLSDRLVVEMNKIIALRDSVTNLKAENYNLVLRYRKRIATLERENHSLFAEVDSLKVVTKYLKNQNLVVTEELNKNVEETKVLREENESLAVKQNELVKKVAIASIIKTSTISAIAMKERSSGKLTSTSRSSRTDAFKVNFKLLANKVTTPGEQKIYVQILDANNNVVAPKGNLTLTDGTQTPYSDELSAYYKNQSIDVLSLILVNRDDINKGVYKINTFIQGRLTGSTSVKLR